MVEKLQLFIILVKIAEFMLPNDEANLTPLTPPKEGN